MKMIPPSFVVWLKTKQSDNSPIGDIARDAANDTDFYQHADSNERHDLRSLAELPHYQKAAKTTPEQPYSDTKPRMSMRGPRNAVLFVLGGVAGFYVFVYAVRWFDAFCQTQKMDTCEFLGTLIGAALIGVAMLTAAKWGRK